MPSLSWPWLGTERKMGNSLTQESSHDEVDQFHVMTQINSGRNWHFSELREQVMHPISFIIFMSFIIFYFSERISGKWIPKFLKSSLFQEFPTAAYAKMLPKTTPQCEGVGAGDSESHFLILSLSGLSCLRKSETVECWIIHQLKAKKSGATV